MDSILVAAVDFGTTYSGWACSFRHEFERDPLKIAAQTWTGGQLATHKGPTCVLIKPDGKTLDSFGYVAETKYSEMAQENKHREWYYFKRFKMMLFRRSNDRGIHRNSTLTDATGKTMLAKTVFTLAIKFLIEDLFTSTGKRICDRDFTEDDIHWVLTVPAIWDDAAKQFMREAAHEAGIATGKLTICLEPEAASLFCRHLPVHKSDGKKQTTLATFKEGTIYMVLDLGGGTVDVTVHEILANDELREIHKASGGAWGGTRVDDAFEHLLGRIIGESVVKKFKDRHMEDYIDLFRDFEIKKRAISATADGQVTIRMPLTLMDQVRESTGQTIDDCIVKSHYKKTVSVVSNKLRIDAQTVRGCFKFTIQSVLQHIQTLLQHPKVSACSAVVMVGGFAESSIIQEAIRDQFGYLDIIIPDDAGLAVLKGAVIYGHTPTAIAERVCKFTYGTNTTHKTSINCRHKSGRQEVDNNGDMRCYDIFDLHVSTGQTVKLKEEGPESTCTPVYETQSSIKWDIYAATEAIPDLVTEEGCTKIGSLTVPIYDDTLGTQREFGATFIFGGTEIEVKVVDKATGEETRTYVDFLG